MSLEDENTREKITSRLGIMATSLKTITIAFCVLNLGGLFTIATAVLDRDYWLLGGILGILIAFGFGLYFASVLNLVVEWMVQVLVTLAEIVARMKAPS